VYLTVVDLEFEFAVAILEGAIALADGGSELVRRAKAEARARIEAFRAATPEAKADLLPSVEASRKVLRAATRARTRHE
jgi:hypothetical protein